MGAIGSYLSKPVTEKISSNESSDRLNCGASSMQGWRVSQEDAHNCVLDYDTKTSFFAVYDGHGGHEVAMYTAERLPDFLKDTEAYKGGDMKKALEDAFLQFDATITTPDVISKLKELAGDREAEEESDEEENVNNLYEEAAMPIEQVIEKYTSNMLNPSIKTLRKDGEKHPLSPFLKARKSSSEPVSCTSSSNQEESSCASESAGDVVTSSNNVKNEANSSSNDKSVEGNTSESDLSSTTKNDEPKNASKSFVTPDIKIDSPDSSADRSEVCTPSKKPSEMKQNGEVELSQSKECSNPEDITSSSTAPAPQTPQENGEVTKKGKGKALTKTKGAKTPIRSTRPKRNARQLYSKLLDFEDSDEDSEDEDDKTFQVESSDEDGEGEDLAGVDVTSDESSVDGEDECDEEEEEEEEEDIDEEDEADLRFAHGMRDMCENPGSDSGCTAVVALLRENELYVANAGDSRCVICRNGKAIDMSFDHKPEDQPEYQRIIKAGGEVTSDGRVNGGLNLSRAIGDHAYKQNKELTDREQMITALPDVKSLTLNPAEDEFMVLACDGIWNFMSSQEVVDFVRPAIQEGKKELSQICEEMFDHCLSPDTLCDGTGCDNMTAIIVRFKSNISKRSAIDSEEVDTNKRAKTEENAPTV